MNGVILVYITFRNLRNCKIFCKIDNQEIKLENDKFGNSFAELKLLEGKHSLIIAQRSWYSTPICYLNIINPIFYIWQLRFFEYRLPKFNNSFKVTKFTFEIFDEKNASLTFQRLLIHDTKDFDFLYYTNGIKNVSVDKKLTDLLQKKRYTITHIFSSIFYMIFLNSLCILNFHENVLSTLLFCAFSTMFSIVIIYQVIKTE